MTFTSVLAQATVSATALVLLASSLTLAQPVSPLASGPAVPEDWGRVPFEAGLRDPDGASHIEAVTAGPRGIVAVGASPTGAAAWYSVDGLSWSRATPPRSWTSPAKSGAYPTLQDVAATDDGFVVVGVERDGPKRYHGNIGSVWVSEDGRIWRRSARGVGPYLTHVIEHGGRLYASSGRVHRQEPGAVWASDDAVDWARVHVAPGGGDVAVIAGDGTTIVAGSDRAMAYSDDGRTWVEAPIERVGSQLWLEDASAFDGGFLAVGARDDRGAAWFSADGRSWEAVAGTIDGGAYITHLNAVTPSPRGGVLITAGTDDAEGLLYRSDDGRSWTGPIFAVERSGLRADPPFAEFAVLGDRVLVVGHELDALRGHSAAVWTRPAPAAQAVPGQAATECPGPRPTIDELVVLDPAARLGCYGDRELVFRAWLAEHTYGDLEYFGPPHWLTAGKGGRRGLAVEARSSDALSVVLHVRPRDRRQLDLRPGRWVVATGHFDDRTAQDCADRWRAACRQAFVVSDVRPARGR